MTTNSMKDVNPKQFFAVVNTLMKRDDIKDNLIQGTTLCAIQFVQGNIVLAQAIYEKPFNLTGVRVAKCYQIRRDWKERL